MNRDNKKFIENISKINEVCDMLMEESKQERIPEVIMFRALRTIVNPDSEETFSNDIDIRLQEFADIATEIIMKFDDAEEWFLSRNSAIPPYTEKEKKALHDKIEKIRELNEAIEEYAKNMNN